MQPPAHPPCAQRRAPNLPQKQRPPHRHDPHRPQLRDRVSELQPPVLPTCVRLQALNLSQIQHPALPHPPTLLSIEALPADATSSSGHPRQTHRYSTHLSRLQKALRLSAEFSLAYPGHPICSRRLAASFHQTVQPRHLLRSLPPTRKLQKTLHLSAGFLLAYPGHPISRRRLAASFHQTLQPHHLLRSLQSTQPSSPRGSRASSAICHGHLSSDPPSVKRTRLTFSQRQQLNQRQRHRLPPQPDQAAARPLTIPCLPPAGACLTVLCGLSAMIASVC